MKHPVYDNDGNEVSTGPCETGKPCLMCRVESQTARRIARWVRGHGIFAEGLALGIEAGRWDIHHSPDTGGAFDGSQFTKGRLPCSPPGGGAVRIVDPDE